MWEIEISNNDIMLIHFEEYMLKKYIYKENIIKLMCLEDI